MNQADLTPTQRFWLPWRGGFPSTVAERIALAASLVFLSGSIFTLDVVQPCPIAVLYTAVILLAASSGRRAWVLSTASAVIVLTFLSYLLVDVDANRCAFRVLAIGIATLLVLRNMTATRMIREQARLLDLTHDAIMVRTMEGTITSWNLGAARLYGWSKDEACGVDAQDLLRTKLPARKCELRTALLSKGQLECESTNVTKDGREVVVQSRWSLLYDERGKPDGILETSNDITHRHEAQERVRESEARYRAIFESTGVSLIECDVSALRQKFSLSGNNGPSLRRQLAEHPGILHEAMRLTTIVDANPACIQLLGAEAKDQLIGPVEYFFTSEGEAAFAEAWLAAHERCPKETMAPLRTLRGDRIEVVFKVSASNESEHRESVFVSLIDVTELNRARGQLEAAQAELDQASRLTSLGQLTASISHEINQPLGSILANAQAGLRWLQRDDPDLTTVKRSLQAVVHDAKRAGSTISAVQILTRNDAPKRQVVDLNLLVKESVDLVRRELARLHVDIELVLSHKAPTVYAERLQLQQVIINLVLNAAQAMATTGRNDRRVSISTGHSDGEGAVAVSDTGPGIDASVRSRLFRPFTTTKTDGMGLGLSICESIVSRQGGRIYVDTRSERGAKFVFALPSGDLPTEDDLPSMKVAIPGLG